MKMDRNLHTFEYNKYNGEGGGGGGGNPQRLNRLKIKTQTNSTIVVLEEKISFYGINVCPGR